MASHFTLKAHLVCFLLLFAAEEPNAFAQGYATELYGVEIGLPSYFTKSITQTPDRAMWVATDVGLVRYNARDVQVFQKELPSLYVKEVITIDSVLYVVSDGGIQRVYWNEPGFRFETIAEGGTTVHYTDSTVYYPKALYSDRAKNQWIIEPTGLNRMKDGRLKRFEFASKFRSPDLYIASLFPIESDKQFFVVSRSGYIQKYDEVTGAFLEVPFSGPGLRPLINGVVQTSETTWFAGAESGLVEIKLGANGVFTWNYKLNNFNVLAVAFSRDEKVFFATKSEGVFVLNKFDNQPILVSNLKNFGINSLYLDSDQNLWATNDQGFALIQPQIFQQVTNDQQVHFTNQLAVSASNDIYAAIETSIFKVNLNPEGGYSIKQLLQVPVTQNLSIAVTSNRLVVANSSGVFFESNDGNEWSRRAIDIKDPLAQSRAYYSIVGPDGSIWFLMYNMEGVFRLFPNKEYLHYHKQFGLNVAVQTIAFSADGQLYAAGNGDSTYLYRFNALSGRFENASLPIDRTIEAPLNIHDITFDPSGRLWLAGNEGLLVMENGKMNRVAGQEHFRRELFSSIAATPNGDIWVGAQNGVYLYRNGVFTLFNNRDGLPSLTVNFRCLRVDNDGRVWVGTINGLAYLEKPISTRSFTQIPEITGFTIDGVPVQVSDPSFLEVSDGSTIEIAFLSIGYPASKMEYQTRLLGLSDHWSPFESSDRKFFQQLSPGKYELQIRAQRRGYPASVEQKMILIVRKHWYETWQARAGYAGFLLILTVAFVRYRQKSRSTKVMEQKLRNTEQQLHTVFQATPMIMFALDKQGLVFIAEGKGFDLAGVDPTHLKGQSVGEIFSGVDVEAFISRVLSGAIVQCELSLNSRTFQVRMVPLTGASGEPGGVLAVGDDLTERIEMEQELIFTREEFKEAKTVAEKANQAKSMFLASMSHELRTPLNAILGFAQILNRDTSLSTKNREYVQILQRSGEHLLAMINDVLDLSKIEAGRMEMSEKLLDFLSLVQELKSMFELMAHEKQLTFELKSEPGVPRFIETDDGKLRQILINLIGNAIKYTQAGSVSITIKREGEQLLICVKDTGRGIPSDQLTAIFEPFRQVRGFNNKGTGLGLAIAYRLAQLMQGRLEVESTVNKGSEFRLFIPIKVSHADLRLETEQSYATPIVGIKGRKNVVAHIVDDVFENRALLKALLEPIGFICHEAENGKEAIKWVQKEIPDVILMDIVMPEMDGREAMHQIRALPIGANIPIIAITASGFEDERRDLLKSGFTGYIRKPFADKELFEVIARLLNIEWEFQADPLKKRFPEPAHQSPLETALFTIKGLEKEEREKICDLISMMDLSALLLELEQADLPQMLRNILQKEAKAFNYRFFMDLDERLE